MREFGEDSWKLLRDAVEGAQADHSRGVIAAGALLTGITLLNRPLGQLIDDSYNGVSAWLGFVWIGLLLILAVLRAHHVQVRDLRRQLAARMAARPNVVFCSPTVRQDRGMFDDPALEVSCAVKNIPGNDNVRTAATDLGVVVEVDGSAQGVRWDPEGRPAAVNGEIELPCNGLPKTFRIAGYRVSKTAFAGREQHWSCAGRGEDLSAPFDVLLTARGSNFDDVTATVRIDLSDAGAPVAELRQR